MKTIVHEGEPDDGKIKDNHLVLDGNHKQQGWKRYYTQHWKDLHPKYRKAIKRVCTTVLDLMKNTEDYVVVDNLGNHIQVPKYIH